MSKKIMFGTTGVILAISIAVISAFALPWFNIAFFMYLGPTPPKPEIKHGEFPFKIELEYKGEKIVKEYTIICDFDGFGTSEANGKYRKWKNRITSDGEFIEDKGRVELLNTNDFSLDYLYLSSEYYMDDIRYNSTFKPSIEIYIGENVDATFTSKEEKFDYFGIKIINIEETPPIKNTFK